jgi:phosphoglycolate phosphatase-like HAD superfamily hydrolase
MQNKLVLFDIDGTLLYTKDPKYRNRFTVAIKNVYGVEEDVDWDTIEGHTDTTVFLATVSKAGVPKKEILEKLPLALEETYAYFVNNIPSGYKDTILPGAREILKRLSSLVHLGILTGNYEKTAWRKLELIKLRHFFEFGVFGHEGEDRLAIARLVQKKAAEHFGKNFRAHHIYIIGDTPKDIACAREIHAHAIAVASGRYSSDELAKHKPDLLVENLLDDRIVQYIV